MRAAELISRNCIHAGVVHSVARRRCLLKEIPLDAPIEVYINNNEMECPTLRKLELDGLFGPLATISWLAKHLSSQKEKLQPGDLVLAATPGSLIPVHSQSDICVKFDTLTVNMKVEA